MTKSIALVVCLLLSSTPANNTQTTLLPDSVIAALSQELSGETARSNLEYIARQHRMRGSHGDFVYAVYGPIPLESVVEYLRALESIKVIEVVK